MRARAHRRALRDVLGALLLCVFALAAAASPSLAAARSFGEVARVVGNAAALRSASQRAADPVVAAAKPAVAERVRPRDADGRAGFGALGPALSPECVLTIAESVAVDVAPREVVPVLASKRSPERARARGPPAAA